MLSTAHSADAKKLVCEVVTMGTEDLKIIILLILAVHLSVLLIKDHMI